MGEVDTKPIKSVQAALTLFEDQSDRTKDCTPNSDELERDEELADLLKVLSNLKVQIKAKESANKQTILKIEHYKKHTNELSTLLKNSEIEKEMCMNEYKDARIRIHELESKINKMDDQLSQTMRIREQVSRLESELISTNEELLQMEADLADSESKKLEGLRSTRSLETELEMEKEKNEEIHVLLSQKEAELRLKTTKAEEAEEKLEDMRKQMEMSKSEIEIQTKKNSDQSGFIKLLEMELDRMRLGIKNTKEEEKPLYPDFENMEIELEKVKIELEEIRQRETEARVEIAVLKSEVHEGQSKIAEAEAVEERLRSENSSLYIAVKQLGLEVEEVKSENKMLRKTETRSGDKSNATSNFIKVSKEEYEALIEKARKGKQTDELETLKTDLESANAKIGELRARAEQGASRAEVAEKGKAKLEERITRWRARREKRKSSILALHESLIPEESTCYSYGQGASSSRAHKTYQPLGEVLNMNF